jgi:DNA-directed RNA polymerase specialized sigma24 family protein
MKDESSNRVRSLHEIRMLTLRGKDETWQGEYATPADFCRIFRDEMKPLYLLAFLLTANHAKAEECFRAALADVSKESGVFKEFASSCVRRVIIAHAIRLAAPSSLRFDETSDIWNEAAMDSAASQVINRLAQLRPLDRFAFVLTVLERYRDVECAVLLGCARRDLMQARMRALRGLGTIASIAQQELSNLNDCSARAAAVSSQHSPAQPNQSLKPVA